MQLKLNEVAVVRTEWIVRVMRMYTEDPVCQVGEIMSCGVMEEDIQK